MSILNMNGITKENFFSEGVKLFNEKKFSESKFKFEQDIVFNPKNEISYLYLSKIFKEQGDTNQQETNLNTVLLINPKNEEALLMLMKIALEKSNYEKVKDLSDKFVKVCINLCDENKDIQETLANIEPKNNES